MAQSIRSRSELAYQLAVACELEHGLCLQYLFTAFTLADEPGEGLSLEELTAVRKWKANIFLVAAQEMLHLAQAANLCAAIGSTVHLGRPNFPQRPDYYPTGLPWGLVPFSRDTMRLYACYERPAVVPPEDARLLGECGFDDAAEAALFAEPAGRHADKMPHSFLPAAYHHLRPRAVEHATIGELYHAIRAAYESLYPPSGELIIGPTTAQIDGRTIDFPQIVKVLSRELGAEGIDLIVRQGEGAPRDRTDSHFGVFIDILREYDALKAKNPAFQPARDVHPNPLSRLHVDNTYPGWRLIHDPFTRDVNDLNTRVYETMLAMLYRFFATPDIEAEVQEALAWSFLRVMTGVIKGLGEALTHLPMGDDGSTGHDARPRMAGPSFEIERALQLVPHAHAAAIAIHESLQDLVLRAAQLADDPRARAPEHRSAIDPLRAASVTLRDIADYFGARLPARPPRL